MKTLVIDFETVWASTDYALSKMSSEAYIRDPRFKAFGLCYKELGSPEAPVWVSHNDIPAWVASVDWTDTPVIAHNFMFDGAILAWVYGAVPAVIFDTLSMARAIRGVDAGGSLAKLAEYYQLPPKGKAVHDTNGLTELTPEIERELAAYCQHDVVLCEAIFQRFMAEGFPKRGLRLIDMTMRMFVQPVLVLDKELLAEHLHEVQHAKANLLINAGVSQTDLASNPKFAALLERYGVECPKKISPTTGKETFALAKSDEGMKALLEHPDPVVQALAAARLGVKSTLEETRTQAFIGTAARGLMPVPLKFYGARTGRWSGEVYNLQNLPRKSKLKNAIQAPEGFVLVGIDLSNIELRVGLWFAGQLDKLALLARGVDLYKDFASAVFNVPYDEVTKDQRFIGKTSQLSLIYGVGHKKLRGAIKLGSGVDIGEEEATRIVNFYRQDYSRVAQAWRNGESVLRTMAANESTTYGTRGIIEVDGKRGCKLPSGMYMQYPGLERVEGEDGRQQWVYHTRKGTEKLYGAKVFQGLTQALAAVIMGDGMLRTAKEYPVALTVHDAEYFIAPENDGASALEFATQCLCTPPKWAAELPLAAEGGYGKSLGDC